ncbi:MAG: type II secretion system F family protein [Chloroflexota bacterium]
MTLPFDPAVLQLRVLLWPLLFGLGAYLLLTAQPIGRPKVDLPERLRRLDIDERVRLELERREVHPIFQSRLLEAVLRPVLDDAGRLLKAWLGQVGITGGPELERKLALARPGVAVVQFFGEKLLSAVIGAALFPLMDGLGIHPFGRWPVWVWLLGGIIGYLAPDWRLEAFLAQRRTLLVMELPLVLDLLCLAASAGLALEQAMLQVAQQSGGVVGQELQQVSRQLALGQCSLVEALEGMA